MKRSVAFRKILFDAESEVASGRPRQQVCSNLFDRAGSVTLTQFVKMSSKEREAELDRQRACLDVQAVVFGVMVRRNIDGQAAEKSGRADEAIRLYEANLTDMFGGSHPYERLRVIYSKRKDYHDALRVMMAFKEVCRSEDKKHKTQEQIDKLWAKIETEQ